MKCQILLEALGTQNLKQWSLACSSQLTWVFQVRGRAMQRLPDQLIHKCFRSIGVLGEIKKIIAYFLMGTDREGKDKYGIVTGYLMKTFSAGLWKKERSVGIGV